jgi:hypothetical protein
MITNETINYYLPLILTLIIIVILIIHGCKITEYKSMIGKMTMAIMKRNEIIRQKHSYITNLEKKLNRLTANPGTTIGRGDTREREGVHCPDQEIHKPDGRDHD